MTIPDMARMVYNLILKHLSKPATASGPAVVVAIPLGSGYSRFDDEKAKRAKIVEYARSQAGVPYKLGAEVDLGNL